MQLYTYHSMQLIFEIRRNKKYTIEVSFIITYIFTLMELFSCVAFNYQFNYVIYLIII